MHVEERDLSEPQPVLPAIPTRFRTLWLLAQNSRKNHPNLSGWSMPLMKCWTAEHRWSRHWHIALDTWWCVLEWKSCPRAIAPGCAAKLPLCHGCLYGSSEAIGELVYEVSWEIIMFIFMTADIHFSTGWVPQHHGAFQDQILFWLKSFAIDFSISFKEFCGELCEGSVRTDTQV